MYDFDWNKNYCYLITIDTVVEKQRLSNKIPLDPLHKYDQALPQEYRSLLKSILLALLPDLS